MHIGPNRLQGDLHRYEFSLETPELAAHVTFTGIVPPARIGTGEFRLGESDRLGWLVAIPRGTVEGTITLCGQTRMVRGLGYHDHNWGSLPFEDYLQEWYWGRAYLGDYTVIFSELAACVWQDPSSITVVGARRAIAALHWTIRPVAD